jgi:ATP-binding cassette subfamily C protein CydC
MRKLALGYLVSSLQALSAVALLASSAWLISRAAEQPSIMYLSIGIVGVRTFALGRAVFRYAERLVTHDATFEQISRLRRSIFAKLIPLAPIGLDVSRGSLLNSLIRDVDDSQERTLRVLPVVFQTVAVTIAGTVMFWFLLPEFAILFLLVAVGSMGAGIIVAQRLDSKTQQLAMGTRAEFSRMLLDRLENQAVLKAYGWDSSSAHSLARLDKSLTSMQARSARVAGLNSVINLVATYISVFVAMYLGAVALANHALSGVLFTVLVLSPLAIFEVYSQIGSATVSNSKFKTSAIRLNELSGMQTGEFVGSDLGGSRTLGSFESLSFKGVVAKYQANSKPICIPDFEFKRGDVLVLSGPSGCGKSTVANLLVGFLKPAAGYLEINGTSISDYSTNSLRQIVGLLEQFPAIFSGSVRANLILAKPNGTDADLIQVLEQVDLWSMLDKREGLDTQLGERGSQLSGGEMQRLAIARNLLTGQELIVLDEPASGVEPMFREKLLLDILDLTKQGKSIILISHDLPQDLKVTTTVTFPSRCSR